MGLELTAVTRVPILGDRLQRSAKVAYGSLGSLCDSVVVGGLLGVLLLVPLAFFSQAQAAYSVPKAALLQSFTAIILAALLIKLIAGRPVILYRSPLDLAIVGYLAVSLVGVLRASAKDGALFGVGGRSDGFITLLSAVALYYVAYNLPSQRWVFRRGLECAAVAGALVAVEGIAESLGFSLLGFDPSTWEGRAFSTAGNPNFLGGVLVLALPLPAVLLATSRQPLRPLWAAALGAIMVGLFVAMTRSAWVGSVAAVALMMALGWRDLRQVHRWLLATLAVVVVFALAFESGVLPRWQGMQTATPAAQMEADPPAADPAASGQETLRRPSALERVRMVGDGSGRLLFWQGALGVWREQPLLGAGYGGLFTAITRHLPVQWAKQSPDTWVDKAHNTYLDHAASLGLPGLLAYLWLIGAFAFAMFRGLGLGAGGLSLAGRPSLQPPASGLQGAQRLLLAAVLAAWAGYLVHLFFLFDTVDTLALFWIFMGLAGREVACGRPAATLRLRLPGIAGGPLAVGAAALAGIVVYWAMLPVVAEAHLWRAQQAGAQHRTGEAVGGYLKAAALNPRSESIQMQTAIDLAMIASAESDGRASRHLLDHSVRIWSRAIQRDPEYAYLYAMRGETYTRYPDGEHMGDALADFRRATRLYPHYYHAYAGVADTAHALGQLGEALAAERKLLELDPNNQQVLRVLAQDYVRSGRWQEAIATWEHLAAVAGDSANLRLSVAQTLLMASQRELGLAEIERARALYPDDENIEQLWQSLQSVQKEGR